MTNGAAATEALPTTNFSLYSSADALRAEGLRDQGRALAAMWVTGYAVGSEWDPFANPCANVPTQTFEPVAPPEPDTEPTKPEPFPVDNESLQQWFDLEAPTVAVPPVAAAEPAPTERLEPVTAVSDLSAESDADFFSRFDTEHAASMDRFDEAAEAIRKKADAIQDEIDARTRDIRDKYMKDLMRPRFETQTIAELGKTGVQANWAQTIAFLREASHLPQADVDRFAHRLLLKLLAPDLRGDAQSPVSDDVLKNLQVMYDSNRGYVGIGSIDLPVEQRQIGPGLGDTENHIEN